MITTPLSQFTVTGSSAASALKHSTSSSIDQFCHMPYMVAMAVASSIVNGCTCCGVSRSCPNIGAPKWRRHAVSPSIVGNQSNIQLPTQIVRIYVVLCTCGGVRIYSFQLESDPLWSYPTGQLWPQVPRKLTSNAKLELKVSLLSVGLALHCWISDLCPLVVLHRNQVQ